MKSPIAYRLLPIGYPQPAAPPILLRVVPWSRSPVIAYRLLSMELRRLAGKSAWERRRLAGKSIAYLTLHS
jgi:hypothetical protein